MSSFLFCGIALAADEPLLVAAASDLAPLEKELIAALAIQIKYPVRFVFGSSGQLAQQIRAGAPYDVYLSANEALVGDLAGSGHVVSGTLTRYARGRIAIWSKSGKFKTLDDLTGPDVRHVAIANPAHAPYGVAARQALEKSGTWPGVESRIVLGESVRQALQFAESGNADAAIVAWSLVKGRGGVLVAAELHQSVIQTGGVVAASKQQELGRKALEALVSAAGQRIFRAAGFEPVRSLR